MSDPFELHTPSVFVVGSPFQALCAIAAIKNLEITDYYFIAVLSGNTRDAQLLMCLKKKRINYCIFKLNKINLLLNVFRNLLPLQGKYERAFIGEFSASFMLGVALPYLKKHACAVYVDDGNAMVSFLNDTFRSWDKKSTQWVYDTLSEGKGIIPRKHFYTIYSDIQNDKYLIGHNDISILLENTHYDKEEKNIVFIGTAVRSYCSQLDISEDSFYQQINKVFDLIRRRYPDDHIVYVPHSNEANNYIKLLCDNYKAEIIFVDTMVEEYVMESPWRPKAIVGLCSTALFNLKQIIPILPTINVLFYEREDCPRLKKYKSICTYYQNNQIECIEWKINRNGCKY